MFDRKLLNSESLPDQNGTLINYDVTDFFQD
jgi:hypothetical protein